MTTPPAPPPRQEALRHYLFLCLTALLVLLLVLLQRGLGKWSLLPVLLGLMCVVLRWRLGPALVLGSLAGLLLLASLHLRVLRASFRPDRTGLSDLLLVMAVAAYVAGHYRLLGLARFLFPRDPRRWWSSRPSRARWPGLPVPVQRTPAQEAATEVVLLLLTLPLWTGLALLCRQWLLPEGLPGFFDEPLSNPELPGGARALLQLLDLAVKEVWYYRGLLWGLGGGVLSLAAVLAYLGWNRQTVAEAELYLQDVVWSQTRREQRRLHSWLMWGREQGRRALQRRPAPPARKGKS